MRCGSVGGGTELQAGRSRVRFPIGSMGFSIDIILKLYYGCGIDSSSNRNEYQEYFLSTNSESLNFLES